MNSSKIKQKARLISSSILLALSMSIPMLSTTSLPAHASTAGLPLANYATSGNGFSIDSSGNLTVTSSVDMETIVSTEWSGQSYNPSDPPTFNNVTVVNGGNLTTSTNSQLVFNANDVNVESGGLIEMWGHAPATGAVATGDAGGYGVGGAGGGDGGGGGASSAPAGAQYGENGGYLDSSFGGYASGTVSNPGQGGGYIQINASSITDNGSINASGIEGQGGNDNSGGDYTRGQGGGGGGEIDLNAPTVNIGNSSAIQLYGAGGGGGAGLASQSGQIGGNGGTQNWASPNPLAGGGGAGGLASFSSNSTPSVWNGYSYSQLPETLANSNDPVFFVSIPNQGIMPFSFINNRTQIAEFNYSGTQIIKTWNLPYGFSSGNIVVKQFGDNILIGGTYAGVSQNVLEEFNPVTNTLIDSPISESGWGSSALSNSFYTAWISANTGVMFAEFTDNEGHYSLVALNSSSLAPSPLYYGDAWSGYNGMYEAFLPSLTYIGEFSGVYYFTGVSSGDCLTTPDGGGGYGNELWGPYGVNPLPVGFIADGVSSNQLLPLGYNLSTGELGGAGGAGANPTSAYSTTPPTQAGNGGGAQVLTTTVVLVVEQEVGAVFLHLIQTDNRAG